MTGINHSELITFALKPMSADFASNSVVVNQSNKASVDFAWIGADANDATAVLQGSNDEICWCDIPGTSFTITTTETCKMFEFTHGFGYFYLRANFTKNSNTAGTMTIRINRKSHRT